MSARRNGCTGTATVTLVGVALTVALAVIAIVALVQIMQNL